MRLLGARRARDMFLHETPPRRTWVVLMVLSGLVLFSGCSGPGTASPEPKAETSAPVILPGAPGDKPEVASPSEVARIMDENKLSQSSVHYVRMMIPHHQQALAMTALAPKRARDDQVAALAARIQDAQTAEIDMMQGWLQRHDLKPVAQNEAREVSDHHRRKMGMATRAEMARLKAATGTEFDRLFLELMITHHQGAVDMAVDALAKSDDPMIRSMAKDVIAAQRDEIATMERMLDRIG